MGANEMTNRHLNTYLTVMVISLAAGVLACAATRAQDQKPERDAVVKSFKQYIKDYVDSYKTHKRVRFLAKENGGVKADFEPDQNYSIDVKTTDSLISPYIGVCEFTMMIRTTAVHTTIEEAEKDNNFIHVETLKHRHTYAFQEGHWVPTLRQNYWDYYHEWHSCDECNAGEPKNDIHGCWELDAKHPVTECERLE